MDYSNISIPRLFKMLADSLGTGNAAEQRDIAQAIAELKGISADEAIQQALREKQDHYLPSLSEQSARAQQTAQLTSQMNAPRQEPIVNAHPFGEPLRSPWESAVETSTSTPIDRTVPNSLGLGTTSRQSIADGLQLPTVGNTIPIEPPATVAASAVEFPAPLLGANGRPVAPTVQPTFGLGRTQNAGLPVVQPMPQANVGPLASLAPPSTPLTRVDSAPAEALMEELTESVTTPTRLANASDSALLNALKPESARTGVQGGLRAARQAEFDSLSKRARKNTYNALGSSDSVIGNLTGGIPEGFVKPERPVIGDMTSAPKVRLSDVDGISDILGDVSGANAVGTAPAASRTVTFGSGGLRGTGVSSDAIGLSKPKGVRGMGGGTSGGLTGLFGNIFGGGGASNPANARVAGASQARAGRGGIFAPGFGTRIQEGLGKLSDPQLNWTKGTGLKAYGHNIGGLASTAQGLYGAYQIADALSENTKAKNTTEDITSDILTAAAGNPMAAYDLTADQKRLLGELKRGSYEDSSDMGSLDWGAGLSGALKGGVAGFLGGGTTGAIVGALSSGVPAAMRGMASEQERKNAELEALYAALSESDARYRDARRQKAMRMYY